jgi:hypothetical protein
MVYINNKSVKEKAEEIHQEDWFTGRGKRR